MKNGKKVGKKRVTAEEFITAWQTSATRGEVAEKTGLSLASVSARAGWFRKKGIDLKSFRAQSLDIDALKALAESLA